MSKEKEKKKFKGYYNFLPELFNLLVGEEPSLIVRRSFDDCYLEHDKTKETKKSTKYIYKETIEGKEHFSIIIPKKDREIVAKFFSEIEIEFDDNYEGVQVSNESK